MNLDEAQKQKVAAWITEGLKLSEIQRRIDKELGVALTYMDVRLLVDDLRMTPKDPEPVKPVVLGTGGTGAGAKMPGGPAGGAAPGPGMPPPAPLEEEMGAGGGGTVKVTVDQLARPGALVSGKVTFSDGKQADWHLDQMGRLGVAPKEKGYKPSAMDVQEFQYELQNQLARLGF